MLSNLSKPTIRDEEKKEYIVQPWHQDYKCHAFGNSILATGNMCPGGSGRCTLITMRITPQTMSFSAVNLSADSGLDYTPYVVRSGVSQAANLRSALQEIPMLADNGQPIRVLISSECIIVPTQEFEEENMEQQLLHVYPHLRSFKPMYNVLPDLNAVVVFVVNKDLNTVLSDHFSKVSYIALMTPVWRQMYQRSFNGQRRKLYVYFHEDKMEVCAFRQNRFCFCNTYNSTHIQDVVYYLLFTWKTLGMDTSNDELHVVGNLKDRKNIETELHRYLSNVYFLNPVAEFNRAPITRINNLPYDLLTLFIRNR